MTELTRWYSNIPCLVGLFVLLQLANFKVTGVRKRCCFQDKFSASVTVTGAYMFDDVSKYGVLNDNHRTHYFYDLKNKRIALERLQSDPGSPGATILKRIIEDYRTHTIYSIDGEVCSKTNLTSVMLGPCVPDRRDNVHNLNPWVRAVLRIVNNDSKAVYQTPWVTQHEQYCPRCSCGFYCNKVYDEAVYKGTGHISAGNTTHRLQIWNYIVKDSDIRVDLALFENGCVPFYEYAVGHVLSNVRQVQMLLFSNVRPNIPDMTVFEVPQNCHETESSSEALSDR